MVISDKINTYLKTDRTFKLLSVKVFFLLGIARLSVLLVPFKRIAGWMGKVNQETKHSPVNLDKNGLDQLGKVIRAVSQFTPWTSNCFAQALCAHWVLKAKKVEHTIYFGVTHDEKEKFQAHAWLRVGDWIVTGAIGHGKYTVVGTFAFQSSNLG